ncbi:hypothetical protein [Alicyclobacillus sp.]|uniref:antibiotic biosynthesis monooxygenase family protein n=1 Tax=Alicyclobacillus sp. TaxID=61169 RepID=UPI0025C45C74|nr:hypothetical protein [Alicyclobacillus sp.]MCL6516370.1 hypothetical protein [Alicyclobacillus sp.]
MYARVIRLALGPNTEWEAQRIADVFASVLPKQPGFRGVTFLANYRDGEYCSISYWDTEQQLLDALARVRPLLTDMVGSGYLWPPTVELFEVYEPKILPISPREEPREEC